MFIRDILYMFLSDIVNKHLCYNSVISTTPKAHSKRSRSSEGETPQPENKQSKMTDNVVSGD